MTAEERSVEALIAGAASHALLQNEISERKQAEAALQRAQAQLTDRAGHLEALVVERTAELTTTNKQLETFIYSIAHDLRAPLRAMEGFSTMLVMEADATLNEKSRDYARRINQSAQFMDAMLLGLLDFSRLSQRRIVPVPVDLAAVVASVLARLQNDIQAVHASVEISGPWPDVLAHEPTLALVLFNLVGNALKFVATGKTPEVHLRAEERQGFIRIWVEDNGLGIAPDHQDQIFGLFKPLNGEKYAGTGTGLAMVRSGVEILGGNVGVESFVGRGSHFWFELPAAPKI